MELLLGDEVDGRARALDLDEAVPRPHRVEHVTPPAAATGRLTDCAHRNWLSRLRQSWGRWRRRLRRGAAGGGDRLVRGTGDATSWPVPAEAWGRGGAKWDRRLVVVGGQGPAGSSLTSTGLVTFVYFCDSGARW